MEPKRPKYKQTDPSRRKHKNARVIVRAVRRDPIDYVKLAEAFVELAIQLNSEKRKNELNNVDNTSDQRTI